MSKFTTQVRFICETYAGEKGENYDDIQNIVKVASNNIFSLYPIFDEAYRETLNAKILTHYYTREIGYETVGLWKLKLNTKMSEIMPYYNQLYQSTLKEFDPFKNFEYSTKDILKDITDFSNNGTSNNNVNSSTNQKTNQTTNQTDYRMFSDTPSGGVQGVDGTTIEDEEYQYLSNVTKNTGALNGEQKGESQSATQGISGYNDNGQNVRNSNRDITIGGKQGTDSYSKLLTEYRETFLNIDMQIINELESLFFGLWE